MRSHRNVVLGATLGALIVAGTLWAGDARRTLPLIKSKPGKPGTTEKAAASNVGQTIIINIDYYESADYEREYHAKIANPNATWQELCDLAIRHQRLELLSSDLGGTLGGTREVGRVRPKRMRAQVAGHTGLVRYVVEGGHTGRGNRRNW